jgi:N-acetylneuraminate synthase
VYIVAEMSANHGRDFDQAVRVIAAAKQAGADAIKVQTYTPDTLTIDSNQEHFRIRGTLWDKRTLYDLYSEAYMPWEWQPRLQTIAQEMGLDFFSTPFDSSSVEFLQSINVPAFKIASFESVDLQLLERTARTGKPIIMSTGMMSLAEIEEAVSVIRAAGNNQLALLKCTSAYPAIHSEMNLRTIPHLAETFGVEAGISDHSAGNVVPITAVALGATIIEKHLTISRALPGPDSAFSMEPHEFKEMVEAVRTTEQAMGSVHYGVVPSEKVSAVFRRSLFVTRDMESGEPFTAENVRSIRPGIGLHTRHWNEVIGRRARTRILKGTPLSWHLIEGSGE